MRITNQMMMSRYKSDVGDAFASMNAAMRRAYDYRAFEKPSENPLAAARTFQVHWETQLNTDYRSNVSNLEGANTTADHVLQQMATLIDTAKQKINSVVTDTANAENRADVANELASIRTSMLAELNSKYADSYLFGGTNAGQLPFTLDADGNLLYRGISVDQAADYTDDDHPISLEDLAGEHVYVDVGLGIGMKGDEVDGQTAFDSAMPGIRYVGYGTNDDGTPRNVFSILKDIEGYLKDDDASAADLSQRLSPLRDALQSAEDEFISGKTEIGSRGNFLEETDGYLEAIGESLAEKDNEVEYVDFQDAITDFSTQQYAYLASLQVGAKVMQTSLMDYLR